MALFVLASASALLQVGVLPALIPGAGPLLPIAVLAAWSAMRGASAMWPALVGVAATLGIVSEERVALFLLALLPTVLLAITFAAPGRRMAEVRRPLRAAGVAAAGAAAYLATLHLAAGDVRGLPDALPALIATGTGTGLIAAFCALALWPLRVRAVRFAA